MNLHPSYALVIASLMVPTVALTLMANRALAAEMPKDFQGNSFQRPWCSTDILKELKDDVYNTDCEDKRDSVEICHGGTKSHRVLRSSQSHQIRCLPLGDDFSKARAGAGSKAIPDKPVESRLSHRAPMQCWRLQAVGDDRDRLGDRKGKHPRGRAARLSVSVG